MIWYQAGRTILCTLPAQIAISLTRMTNSLIEEKPKAALDVLHQETLACPVTDDSNNAPVQEQRMTIQTFFTFLVRLSLMKHRGGLFLNLQGP